MATQQPTAEQIAEHDAAEAAFAARVANDYDPQGFLHYCEEHSECFFTYCVHCPEDTGNGKVSEAAIAAQIAERDARWIAESDVPF
ncbi:hypothetical protein SEA_OTTAWA_62 [Arthrobacter phage Ottawa]|nr:hypothetical protein SEA_KHARCHO_62 [Arthrobacter phage Kharcho]WIC89294.1 hypothetical protein SEA_OTTAWA_62 [Arthrobacter phage Ottawa]